MNEALEIIKNKAEKVVWDKRNGSQRMLDKSDLCPISGNWLIPASCTEEKPPKVEDGYKVSFQNGEWITEKTEEQIEKEETRKYEPVVKSLREQIEELKAEIEQLKFEKEEIKLDIANARKEVKDYGREADN
jgi:predicted RNase H-like nuclease (RuvC/YqgF family)